jgi:hypothetical protein
MHKIIILPIMLTIGLGFVKGQPTTKSNLTPRQQQRMDKLLNSIEHPEAYYNQSESIKYQYDKGMISAKTLKTKSVALLVTGALIGGAGFLVPSNGSDYTKPAFFVVGGTAITTGIVCLTISNKRKKEMKMLLNTGSTASRNMNPPGVKQSIGLQLRF